jgi:spermidine synthase
MPVPCSLIGSAPLDPCPHPAGRPEQSRTLLDGRERPRLPRRRHVRRLAAAIALLLSALAASAAGIAPPAGERLVHREVSPWQTIVVTDSPTRRCLRFGDGANQYNQSCREQARPAHLVFDYTRAMAATLLLWDPPPACVLLIGVGGGSIATALATARPAISIDAVDIDQAVLRVAERYFGLRAGPNLRLHAMDGRAFVAAAHARGQKFDAVLLDAFDAEGIPPALFTDEFLRQIRAVLSPNGVFLANTFRGSPSAAQESAAALSAFGVAYSVRSGRNATNRLIVASASPDRLPSTAALLAGLPARRVALARIGIDDGWVRRLTFTAIDAGR